MKVMTGVKAFFAAAVAAAGLAAFAAPAVTVNSVTENGTWSTINVNYTLSGVDTAKEYEVLFDVTADGMTKSVTNDLAKLENKAYTKAINTKTLFGSARRNAKAKVTVSLIPEPGGVQLWANGPIWAECNIGATKPEEYGYYFWWGDTVGYIWNGSGCDASDGSTKGFLFNGANATTSNKDNTWLTDNGWIDASGNLTATHDAARVHLGRNWRLPTKAEFEALISKCSRSMTTQNGVYGCKFTGKGDYSSNSIFIPACGSVNGSNGSGLNLEGTTLHYWSSTPVSDVATDAWELKGQKSSQSANKYRRYLGMCIRPVR